VAGDGAAHVFDADIALDDADAEITQLSAHADDQACQQELPGGEMGEEKRSAHGTAMEKAAAPIAPPQVLRGLMLLRSG